MTETSRYFSSYIFCGDYILVVFSLFLGLHECQLDLRLPGLLYSSD